MIAEPEVRLSLPIASISFQIAGAESKSSVPGTKKSPSKFSMVKAAGQSETEIWSQVWFSPWFALSMYPISKRHSHNNKQC